MDARFSPTAIATAVRRYLAGESGAEELRAYLAACDEAIRTGEAEGRLSGPVGAVALALMEQEEGVRPAADVRSSLASVVRALIHGQPVARREPRGRPPRPPRPAAAAPDKRPRRTQDDHAPASGTTAPPPSKRARRRAPAMAAGSRPASPPRGRGTQQP